MRTGAADKKRDFESVYREYYPRVFRYVYSKLGTQKTAEDLAQDILVACYRNYSRFDPKRASLSTWVFVIARNRLKNHYRDRKSVEYLDAQEGVDYPAYDRLVEDAICLESDMRLLTQALEALPARERRVVRGRYLEGLKAADLAEELDTTPGNVRVIQTRALTRIREALIAAGYER